MLVSKLGGLETSVKCSKKAQKNYLLTKHTPFYMNWETRAIENLTAKFTGRDSVAANIVWFMKLPVIRLKFLPAVFIINKYA